MTWLLCMTWRAGQRRAGVQAGRRTAGAADPPANPARCPCRTDAQAFLQALYTDYFYSDTTRRIYKAGVQVCCWVVFTVEGAACGWVGAALAWRAWQPHAAPLLHLCVRRCM